MKRLSNLLISLGSIAALIVIATGCNDSKSYADLLGEETKAINNYLADQTVENEIPADSIFLMGKDAPYYRLDPDGNVYMRVISNNYPDDKAEYNDLVYLRFTRYNLKHYVDGKLPTGSGTSEDVSMSETIRYQNFSSTTSSTWGEGIQVPLSFLGYGCEVEIVVRSQSGRSDEISVVIPYLYRIRYYKSQI